MEVFIEVVGDEVEGLRVVLYLGVQTSEVKSVEDVVFLNFAKVFVPFGGEEPGYPLGEGELGSMISNTREGRGSWKRIG